MTREEIFSACKTALSKHNVLLLEAATGTGKTRISIDLVNWLIGPDWQSYKPKMLLLVAKRVHKVTWQEEIEKWGGIHCDMVIECYESLHKHTNETFDFILMDEVHHIGSEARMKQLSTLKYGYMLGLSATIPRKVKQYFKFHYHSLEVKCDIVEAIQDDVLPEPEILLFPLQLDNTIASETWEVNPKSKGPIYGGEYKDIWKFKKNKQHAILSCTQRQKSNELNALVLYWKNTFNRTRRDVIKQLWLHTCGQRLEFYSDTKIPKIQEILKKLEKERTITFCKTIDQCEQVGKNCIHSQNREADKIYSDFNAKKLNHITAVNILNENANLVDCKYAIFGNLSSSEVVIPQRLGRAMRHKHPVIIVPFYQGTREAEIVDTMFKDYNQNYIRVIHSIEEI